LLSFPRLGEKVVYRWVFEYGVRPWNIVATIVVVILFFAVVFFAAQYTDHILPGEQSPAFVSRALNGLYFSVTTFATVGYEDVGALGWAASAARSRGSWA